MNTLHLTTSEQSAFDALSEQLREGWTVKPETLTFKDTDHRRRIRFELLRIEDPAMQKFMASAAQAESPEAFEKLVQSTDFSDLSDSDFSELMFAIGPDGVTSMLGAALASVKTDEDVAYAAELSHVRHGILESLQNFSS